MHTFPTDSLDDADTGSIPDSWLEPEFIIDKMLGVLTNDKDVVGHKNSREFREDTIKELKLLKQNPSNINLRRVIRRNLEIMSDGLERDEGVNSDAYKSIHLVLLVFYDQFPSRA